MSMCFCSFVERKNKHLGTGFANLNVNKILVLLKKEKKKKENGKRKCLYNFSLPSVSAFAH